MFSFCAEGGDPTILQLAVRGSVGDLLQRSRRPGPRPPACLWHLPPQPSARQAPEALQRGRRAAGGGPWAGQRELCGRRGRLAAGPQLPAWRRWGLSRCRQSGGGLAGGAGGGTGRRGRPLESDLPRSGSASAWDPGISASLGLFPRLHESVLPSQDGFGEEAVAGLTLDMWVGHPCSPIVLGGDRGVWSPPTPISPPAHSLGLGLQGPGPLVPMGSDCPFSRAVASSLALPWSTLAVPSGAGTGAGLVQGACISGLCDLPGATPATSSRGLLMAASLQGPHRGHPPSLCHSSCSFRGCEPTSLPPGPRARWLLPLSRRRREMSSNKCLSSALY
ncbi:alpha-N-acetylgalactosaminide alpha-2,6-sialyltransferase 6 isoform X4 [Pipistrellus kuhlii]|uniref:alpha-N-acetylgalactosaminide alpha-2,6-sialyltransferase 6 isoform X4 n=1 Tax=Pipistrellus kuhlii TaxID=59472 RepID=UPI001E271637|nr:alpha-N-acetylgalactosaminide alpha-2,6-sialyltransferase 6 isoform X4 [Pipistrellus kuhlii]